MHISDEYNKYIEAVNLRNHHIISPFVITPKELCEQLNNYKGEFEFIILANYKNKQIIRNLISSCTIIESNSCVMKRVIMKILLDCIN